jgi:putative FmdB family regulatory protein
MPVYDYECSRCNKVHEVTQKFSDSPLVVCPDETCLGPVKKLLSLGTGFSLKGTGFYTTDYKRAKAPTPNAAPASGAAPASIAAASPGSTSTSSASPAPATTPPKSEGSPNK